MATTYFNASPAPFMPVHHLNLRSGGGAESFIPAGNWHVVRV
jgi:hypothetical protein